MPRKVERELFVDAARAGDMLQAVVDGIKRRHTEQIAVAGKTPVFIQQEERIRQKFDDIFRLGLLAVAADPPIPVRILFELVVGQQGHIGIADARETGEQEHVAVIILTLIAQRSRHHPLQLLFGQKNTIRIRGRVLIKGKGIAGHPAVVEGDLDNIFQAAEIPADRRGLQTKIRFQVNVILFDERLFQLCKRHVANTVLLAHEGT